MGTAVSGRLNSGTMGRAETEPVSLEEYLRTSYEPDAEYVDGWIEERATGERDHSTLQRQLLLLLSSAECLASFQCFPELRVQTSANHFRVPDLCLIGNEAPWERIVRTPPMLCVEVLSPEDTMSRTLTKVRDFLAMGVPEVWVFDPETRSVEVCRGATMISKSEGTLNVPGTTVSLTVESVFRSLDRG